MDVSLLLDTEFQLAIDQFEEYRPDQFAHEKELKQVIISNDRFSTFCENLVIPTRKKALEGLLSIFNKNVEVLDRKHNFLLTNGEEISNLINERKSQITNEKDRQEYEHLQSIKRKYLNDLKSIEELEGIVENLGDNIEAKLSSIETSTIYKLEFTDQAYKTGSTIANTLRDELIAAGLINSSHANSSKENFKLLFHSKNTNPYLSAQPIVWLGSYPQLYYLITNLTKNVIKLKRSKPSHIDVIFHVFREHSENSPFLLTHRRPNDPPAEKTSLDKIIASVESQIVIVGK